MERADELCRLPFEGPSSTRISPSSARTLNGTQEIEPRWKRGVTVSEGALGEVMGRLYVAKHFPPEAKARMEQLVQNLLAAYKESITTLDWMTAETRQKALAKLATFSPKIGYPNKWRDYSALEVKADDLVGNVMRSNVVEHEREIAKLASPSTARSGR